jgi:hypothetical protein
VTTGQPEERAARLATLLEQYQVLRYSVALDEAPPANGSNRRVRLNPGDGDVDRRAAALRRRAYPTVMAMDKTASSTNK